MNFRKLTNPVFVILGFCLLLLGLATGCGGGGGSSNRPPQDPPPLENGDPPPGEPPPPPSTGPHG